MRTKHNVSCRLSVVSCQLSAFILPPSAFRLLPSAFRLPPSAFRLLPSAFRLRLLLPDSALLTTDNRPLTTASDLKSLVLREQLCDLGVDRLFFGEIGDAVSTLYQFLDLKLDLFLSRLRLSALAYIVLIIHTAILLLTSYMTEVPGLILDLKVLRRMLGNACPVRGGEIVSLIDRTRRLDVIGLPG